MIIIYIYNIKYLTFYSLFANIITLNTHLIQRKERKMYRYKFLIRRDISNRFQTFNTHIMADNDYQAKMIAEGMFGIGSVLHFTREPQWQEN